MSKRRKKRKQNKLLSGTDLADFIKVRHELQARRLTHKGNQPHLAIVQALADPRISVYVGAKQRYGEDVGIKVSVYTPKTEKIEEILQQLNEDDSVHGIIVQLPLPESVDTDEVLNMIDSEKDVDGLRDEPIFDPATQMAIMWLIGGYNIQLKDKTIVVVGQGRLVGKPLTTMLQKSDHNVIACDEETENLKVEVQKADVLISATGQSGLITTDMVQKGAVVIDAGVTTDNGELVGDVANELYERDDLKITPKKGGVGPLTVAALFDNVLRAAERTDGTS